MGVLSILLSPAEQSNSNSIFHCNLGRTIPIRECKIVAWSVCKAANVNLRGIRAEIPFLTSSSNTLIANSTTSDDSGHLFFPVNPTSTFETHKEDMHFSHLTQIPSLFTVRLYDQSGAPLDDSTLYMTIQIEFHQNRLI